MVDLCYMFNVHFGGFGLGVFVKYGNMILRQLYRGLEFVFYN